MSEKILFDIAIVMLSALVCGRLVKHLNMPNVTGYLIAGLILGPCVLNVIPENMVNSFSVASDMALGFIAFSIGSEFKISYFKKVGAAPFVIACLESFGAVAVVIVVGFSSTALDSSGSDRGCDGTSADHYGYQTVQCKRTDDFHADECGCAG